MKLLIADDHVLVREGMRHSLGELAQDIEILEAENAEQVLDVLGGNPDLDVAILDLIMPGANGFELLIKVCEKFPDIPVILMSASEDPDHMRKVIDYGASGYIPKSASRDVMLSAVKLVLSGGVYIPPAMLQSDGERGDTGFGLGGDLLGNSRPKVAIPPELTSRQLDVLLMLGQGKSNKEIARDLGLSENTVKIHVTAILKVLNVSNRTQAGIIAQTLDLSSVAR
ncbi:MAG TPA: response regulator transcription factor [Gammaproteobacteria bacterium]|nr:response regulator transcription factor [Gammaproteobacteria bacterium]